MKHFNEILKLSYPIIIGQLGLSIQGLVDVFMLGNYSKTAIASAGFVSSMLLIIIVLINGFATGLMPLLGVAFSQGDKPRMGEILKNSFLATGITSIITMLVAVLFFANIHKFDQPKELITPILNYFWIVLPSLFFNGMANVFKNYFDSKKQTKIGMILILVGNVWNIIFNYFLIYGKCGFSEMGVEGAAIATLSARILMVVIFVVLFVFGKKYQEDYHYYKLAKIKKDTIIRLNKMGWPISLQMGFECSSFSICSIIVGWLGTNALAAHQIIINVAGLFWIIYVGFSMAACVLVSHHVAKNDNKTIREITFTGLKMVWCAAFIIVVLFYFFQENIARVFTDDEQILSLMLLCTFPIMIYQISDSSQTMLVNCLRGIGRVKYMIFDGFLAYYVIQLPLSYVFGITLNFGIAGVWYAFPCGLTVAAILYWMRFNAYTKK